MVPTLLAAMERFSLRRLGAPVLSPVQQSCEPSNTATGVARGDARYLSPSETASPSCANSEGPPARPTGLPLIVRSVIGCV